MAFPLVSEPCDAVCFTACQPGVVYAVGPAAHATLPTKSQLHAGAALGRGRNSDQLHRLHKLEVSELRDDIARDSCRRLFGQRVLLFGAISIARLRALS